MASPTDQEKKIKQLYGSTPQGYAGRLMRESQLQWRYESTEPSCALSLTMPVRFASYGSNTPHPIFAMNLPEGEQFHRIRTRFAKQFSKLDEMAILSIVGHNQIGRVMLSEQQDHRRESKAILGLQALLKTSASVELFESLFDQYYDAGISGAQPKVLIPDGDVHAVIGRETARIPDLIVKTGGAEYPHLSANEYACMLAARKAGIDVPEFHLSDDASLFIMRRFDLIPSQTGEPPQRLGFEDFAVLSGATYDTLGDYKYRGNYEGIAALIGRLCPTDGHLQQAKFFEYLCLSVLVGNGDAHLKNFALLYEHPANPASVHLAPLYDVVTTSAYDFEDRRTGLMQTDRELALKLNKSKSLPTREELIAFGRAHCRVSHPARVMDRIEEAKREAWSECKTLFPQAMAERMAKEWALV
jgi:serine/threonine-protein kinase HipA